MIRDSIHNSAIQYEDRRAQDLHDRIGSALDPDDLCTWAEIWAESDACPQVAHPQGYDVSSAAVENWAKFVTTSPFNRGVKFINFWKIKNCSLSNFKIGSMIIIIRR